MIMLRARSIVLAGLAAIALLSSIASSVAQPAPVPALPDAERRTSYSITASTCQCAVNFALYGDSTDYQNWVEVWINGINAAYNDPAFGWKITSPSGPLANLARPISNAVLTFNGPQTGTIQIVGARRPRRVAQFAENAGVSARNLNQAITDIVAQNRETWDRTNDIAGRAPMVPPGETMGTLPPLAGRANMGVCFDANGRFAPCVAAPSGSFIAGAGIQFTGTNPTTISSTAVGNANVAYVSSRAIAQTLDLHTYSVVITGGYAQPGDGGGGTFRNVGSAVFLDQQINTTSNPPTLVGGSLYTNGVYLGVPLTGGGGNNCMGQVTVSGGAVVAVQIAVPCMSYAVGNVLTTPNAFIGNTGSGFTWTVNATSTPLASFADSIGTHFQYTVDQGNFINTRQFGCKLDWHKATGDGAATNDQPCIQAALSFASINDGGSLDNSGYSGQRVIQPAGASLSCGGLVVPQGVIFSGQGNRSSEIVGCIAEFDSVHTVTLCDILALSGQFGCRLEHMGVRSQPTTSSGGVAAIYSESGQQQTLVDDVSVYTNSRSCLSYQRGAGGAANAIFHDFECNLASTVTGPAVIFSSSGTIITLTDYTVGCGVPCNSSSAVTTTAGRLALARMDCERFVTCVVHNVSNGDNGVIRDAISSPNPPCDQFAALLFTNTPGNLMFENIQGSCTHTILNGQPSGVNFNGSIQKPITCGVGGTCN